MNGPHQTSTQQYDPVCATRSIYPELASDPRQLPRNQRSLIFYFTTHSKHDLKPEWLCLTSKQLALHALKRRATIFVNRVLMNH